MERKQGKIIIQSGANVWPHELKTAQSYTAIGKDVEFYKRSDVKHATSTDCIIDGEIWEMKAPTVSSLRRVQRILRDTLKQSRNVIFDSRRMKSIPDNTVERELRKWAPKLKRLRRLQFVNRHGVVVNIK